MADANNIDAWESPIKVPPSNSQRPEWYGRKEIPLVMTLENCGNDVDAHQVYTFVAKSVTDATAYVSRPTGFPKAAAWDFYLIVSSVASVVSIANVLWMAYDRFIAPRNRSEGDSVVIKIAVWGSDSTVQLRLRNVSEKDFFRGLEIIISEATQPGLQSTHEQKIRELEESDSWMKI